MLHGRDFTASVTAWQARSRRARAYCQSSSHACVVECMDRCASAPRRMTALLSVDPTTNRFRFFVVELRAEVGGAVLLKRWGRVGTAGRRATERFDNVETAQEAFAVLLEKRARHGYVESGAGPLSVALRVEADLAVEVELAPKFDLGLALALDGVRRKLARMRSSTLRARAPNTTQLELPGLAA